jgi:GNAT superfamily N-acetyltransferase
VQPKPLEDVSLLSLSKRLPALNSTVLHTVYQDKPIAFIAVVSIRMRAKYYQVSRLVVLPDYQGIGFGKRLLNFIAELYTSQTKKPFYILTSNPQIIRGNMKNWKITRFGHASRGRGNTRINNEIRCSLSRKRITVSLQYVPAKKSTFIKRTVGNYV